MGGRTRRCAQTSMHKPLCTNPSHKPFAQTPAQNAQNAQTRTNPHKPAQTCAQKEFFSIKYSIINQNTNYLTVTPCRASRLLRSFLT